MKNWRHNLLRRAAAVLFFGIGVWFIPHFWCGREADGWFRGDAQLQQKLARGVERWVATDLGRENFTTGSSQFNGEWLFGAYLMAGMGFGQTAQEHPEWRARHLELMSACIDRILTPAVREFDRESWGNDPMDSLDGDHDHAAYLGYFNLLLSLHRLLDPKSRFASLNDRITAALVRRLERSSICLLQTYPREVYPVDNCAVVGSIGLYDRATGADHSALRTRWISVCREKYQDKKTGLLYQAVDPDDGRRIDAPRGSGTTLGSYFLSFGELGFSRELHQAVIRELARKVAGFGVVREYPKSVKSGRGDIDSGPVLFGIGLSSTGFMLAGARIHGDGEWYSSVYATSYLFGGPLDRGERREYVTGGPLGNAIMLAMLTAQPSGKRP